MRRLVLACEALHNPKQITQDIDLEVLSEIFQTDSQQPSAFCIE